MNNLFKKCFKLAFKTVSIDELQESCKIIISGKFPRAETKLFQTDVDEGRNNFEIIYFT